ncbi:MAG TPA: hypothetical protein VFI28_01530 [Candidatus Limnocylindrales bacterium]|nr:hypothetical protein [Candidatus Limnocylindrales bacterium]
MASRADHAGSGLPADAPDGQPPALGGVRESLPAAPGLRSGLRRALQEFYFNSWRLVPANLVWGAGLLGLYVVANVAPVLAIVALPLLALPTVGLFRLAALIARDEPAALGDAFAAWRRFGGAALVIGTAAVVALVVFSANVVTGVASGGVLGWGLATLAGWGLAMTGLVLLAAWPLLVDPWRAELGLRARLRLGALMVLASPGRLVTLGLLCAIILAVSTVAFAALVMVSVAFVAMLASMVVLPAADRLEARLGGPVRRAPIDE